MADEEYYLYDFWLFEGNESERSHLPHEIVMGFVDRIQAKSSGLPYIIVADSYYSSLDLAIQLYQRKLGCLLSCRADRPSALWSKYIHKGLQKGQWTRAECRDFSAVSYYDKAKVNLLTNLFLGCKPIQNSNQTKQLPQALYYYRKWLGSVDHFDRQLHSYFIQHRNYKWTSSLLAALLKMAVNNTWIIRRHFNPSITLKETMSEIVEHLTGNHSVRGDNNRPLSLMTYDRLNHWTEPASKNDCVYCLSQNKQSKTTYQCSKCHVHLHPLCMQLYHTKQ